MHPSVTFFALNQVGEGAKVHVANVGYALEWDLRLNAEIEVKRRWDFLEVDGIQGCISFWISSFTKFGSGN